MTRTQANQFLAVILETVAESTQGVPSGHLYAALMTAGVTLDQHELLLNVAKTGGLVDVARSHLVTITPKGQEMVAKIKAFKQA